MSPSDLAHHVRLEIAEDKLSAALVVDVVVPPGEATEQSILNAFTTKNLTLSPELKDLARTTAAELCKPRTAEFRLIVARGVAPVDPIPGRIEFQPGFDPASARQKLVDAAAAAGVPGAAGVDAAGSVDHYSRSFYHIVKPGDHVASLIYPAAGQEGRDVFGKPIKTRETPPLDFTVDDTLLKQADGRIIAMRPGVLEWADGGLHITENLKIDEYVDFSTGHVDFPGSVEVAKGVRDCFRVHAAKDLSVKGLIEAAPIIAGRDANLSGGMAARDKGSLTVQRDALVKYLNNVTVTIGRDLKVEKEIVNCRVSVGRAFDGPNCAVAGGRFAAACAVRVGVLGSETGVTTEILLGHIPELESVLRDSLTLMPALEARKAKVLEPLEQLRSVGGKQPASHVQRVTELERELEAAAARITTLHDRLTVLRNFVKSRTNADLTVINRIHRKVVVSIGNYTVDFHEEVKGPVRLCLDAAGYPQLLTPDGKPVAELPKLAKVRKIDLYLHKAA